MPPPECLYFSADCYENWYRCKTSHDLKDSIIKISQDHHVGALFHKMWPNIRKYDRKYMAYTLKDAYVWGSNSNCDILYLWWLRQTFHILNEHLLQLMVQTLNETAIYHMEILTLHKMAPNTFYKMTKYSFKNQCSMHGNDENMLFWSQFKFRNHFPITISWMKYLFLILLRMLVKKLI